MDCKEASQFLYALADGELADTDRALVQAHVDACAGCRRRVEAQRLLKTRIREAVIGEPAPATLRSALTAALTRADVTPEHEVGSASVTPASGPVPNVIPIRRLFASVVALAAMVALAVVAYDQWPSGRNGPGDVRAATVTFTDTSPTAVALADRLYDLHMAGQRGNESHQDPGLPRAGREAALAMSRDLDSTVLWCGRLATLTGQFESADYCELVDVRGGKHRGAHLVFRCPEGTVSLVSFPKLDEMAEVKKAHYGSRDYAILCPSKCGGSQPTTIVGFNCPVGSHFVCAPMEPAKVIEMAEPMRPIHDDATASMGSDFLAFLR